MTWSRKEHGTFEVPGKSVIFTLNQYKNINVYSWFLSDDMQGENEKSEGGTWCALIRNTSKDGHSILTDTSLT